MTVYQKVKVLIFSIYICVYISPKRQIFNLKKIKFDHSLVFSCSHVSLPHKLFHKNLNLTTFLYHGPMPFFILLNHLFCLSHRKTHWTLSVDNVGLKTCLSGTLNSMVSLTYFPWCNPKWSRYEFNNQLHILQCLGTTSRSMV